MTVERSLRELGSVVLLTFLFWFQLCAMTYADTIEYELFIEEKTIEPASRRVQALTINGGIPGPVLRFKEGDTARVRVYNKLKKEDTSVHWHGLLLPNVQDGVPYLTTPPIRPGTSHVFEYPLRHSGTYWYHSHSGLQEQRGIYGAIVVEPLKRENLNVDREYVLVLSDWSDEHPDEIMRSLKRGSEFYSFKKNAMQSLWGAYKTGMLSQYLSREWNRMLPMDLSDVAYDAFLINGKSHSRLDAKPGERIRLRVINAGASTYFYLNSAMGPMTVVAADGPSVEPFDIERLFISMAETYDVIVTVPENGSWEVRATAQDGTGHASVFIGSGPDHFADAIQKANLYDMDLMMLDALKEGNLIGKKFNMQMAHGTESRMHMSKESQKVVPAQKPRPFSPYRTLRALTPTSLPAENDARTIILRLTGDMKRYMWSFNGKTLFEESTIPVRQGENLRIEMINDTMMHHPIHLHGHFFRLLNGQGDRAPLKHTVDVPPMSRRVIEFEANEEKDWLFHCHLLYHMMAGMTRVISYQEQGADHKPNLGPEGHPQWFAWGAASIQSHMSEGVLTLSGGRTDFRLMWETEWESGDSAEREVDLIWEHYFNANLQTFFGARYEQDNETEYRGVGSVRYRLPGLLYGTASVDTEGELRLGLEKEYQLTRHLAVFGEGEYDTRSNWEGSTGLTYILNKWYSVIAQYHSMYGGGGGIVTRF